MAAQGPGTLAHSPLYFAAWNRDGTLDRVHDALRARVGSRVGRQPSPSAGVVDAQPLRGADPVGTPARGYDAGTKANGRGRHIVVDSIALLLVVMLTAASLQGSDRGHGMLRRVHRAHVGVRRVVADDGDTGQLVAWAARAWRMTLDIVRKPPRQQDLAAILRPWVMGRTFASTMHCQRLVRDYERTIAHPAAMVKWAMVGLVVRRHAPSSGRRAWVDRR
ncbi:MAG TPA: transposase [Verrucomicrobiae bacterium]|nr:transposase [Verrucomicrobiae bacterium]